jgi:hypothetical protein
MRESLMCPKKQCNLSLPFGILTDKGHVSILPEVRLHPSMMPSVLEVYKWQK